MIFRIRVILDVEEDVLRDIEIEANNTLKNLHEAISKSFGLAGLRVGYTITNKKFSALLNKFRPMYEINSIGVLACLQILKNSFIRNKYISDTNKGLKLIIKHFYYYNTKSLNTLILKKAYY